ncbi:MAG: L-serine ammonia-lyase, iron-sulfur-dependent subunit beta [bacterium]
MKYISILDIIGPTMIGPSSSHTAGAIRLALLARNIYGKKPGWVKFTLYNSFAKTGKGHGTDKALIAGILGFKVDDPKIKNSYEFAKEESILIEFETKNDPDRHPNSVDFTFYNETNMFVSGKSLGAGEVEIDNIKGFKANIRGDLPTLFIIHKDKPGMLSKVTEFLQEANVNIATLHCERNEKGKEAAMTICLDSMPLKETIKEIENIEGVYIVRSINVIEK